MVVRVSLVREAIPRPPKRWARGAILVPGPKRPVTPVAPLSASLRGSKQPLRFASARYLGGRLQPSANRSRLSPPVRSEDSANRGWPSGCKRGPAAARSATARCSSPGPSLRGLRPRASPAARPPYAPTLRFAPGFAGGACWPSAFSCGGFGPEAGPLPPGLRPADCGSRTPPPARREPRMLRPTGFPPGCGRLTIGLQPLRGRYSRLKGGDHGSPSDLRAQGVAGSTGRVPDDRRKSTRRRPRAGRRSHGRRHESVAASPAASLILPAESPCSPRVVSHRPRTRPTAAVK